MKKAIVICLLILIFPILSYSQSAVNLDSLIIQGKAQLFDACNKWTEIHLLNARAYFERLLMKQSDSWLVQYYIGLADYRLTSFYFSKNKKDKAKKYIDEGIKYLQLAIETKENFSEAHCLLSSLYGNKIATNPFLCMTLGPKSGMEMGKAKKIEPKNPRNYLIAGWSAYFTPKLFGGGKNKAKKNFEQAIAYFDSFKVDNPVLPDWGHEEAYAWLGIVQVEMDEFVEAEANYKKAIEINHDYDWVHHALLPDLKKKMAEKKK